MVIREKMMFFKSNYSIKTPCYALNKIFINIAFIAIQAYKDSLWH
mgnify:CR=1 FL=1